MENVRGRIELLRVLGRARDAVCVTTPGGEVVFWNRAAERLVGHRTREALGRACTDLLATAPSPWQPPSANGFEHTFQARVRTRGGRWLWLDVAAMSLDVPGAAGLVVYLFRDITRSKELLRQLRERFPREHAEEPLTPREREVLRALAAGLGTVAVAERLRVSRATIRNHAQNIFGKLGVHTRLEAVMLATRRGLL